MVIDPIDKIKRVNKAKYLLYESVLVKIPEFKNSVVPVVLQAKNIARNIKNELANNETVKKFDAPKSLSFMKYVLRKYRQNINN